MELETFGEFHKGRCEKYIFQIYGQGNYYSDAEDIICLKHSLRQNYVSKEPVSIYSDKTDECVGSLYPSNDPAIRWYNVTIDGTTYSIRSEHLLNVIIGNQNAGELKRYQTPELEPGQMTLFGVTA